MRTKPLGVDRPLWGTHCETWRRCQGLLESHSPRSGLTLVQSPAALLKPSIYLDPPANNTVTVCDCMLQCNHGKNLIRVERQGLSQWKTFLIYSNELRNPSTIDLWSL